MTFLEISFAWKDWLVAAQLLNNLSSLPISLNIVCNRSHRCTGADRLSRGFNLRQLHKHRLAPTPLQSPEVLPQRVRADLDSLFGHGLSDGAVAVPSLYKFPDPISVRTNQLKQCWRLVGGLLG